jgi:hypothetical protein
MKRLYPFIVAIATMSLLGCETAQPSKFSATVPAPAGTDARSTCRPGKAQRSP